MGKTEKLDRQIERYHRKIEAFEAKIAEAKERAEAGIITKSEFNKTKLKYQERARAYRAAIRRKQKAKILLEKKYKERKEEEAKRAKELAEAG